MFTSTTVILTVVVSVAIPSDTITLNVYVPGPWLSVGVQENIPSVVIAAPVGSPSRLNVSVWDGISTSDAVAIKVNKVSSSVDLSDIGSITGGSFCGFMLIVTVAWSYGPVVPDALYVKLSLVVSLPSWT